MPGLLIDTGHVANECVAVALFTLLIWLSLQTAHRGLIRLVASRWAQWLASDC